MKQFSIIEKLLIHGIAFVMMWAPVMAIDIRPFLRGRPTIASSFTANGALYSASDHYIRYNANTIGVSDGRLCTISFWVDFDGSDGVTQSLFAIGQQSTHKFHVLKGTDNLIQVIGITGGGTTVLSIKNSTTLTASHTGFDGSDGWNHIFICIDITSATQATREAACKIYLNGVAETVAFTTTSNANPIDFVPTNSRVTVGANCATSSGFNPIDGSMAEFVFYDTYHDIPSSFYLGTIPADIGSSGSTPTGSPPDIYLSRNGSGDLWATDSSGNNNNFTVNNSPLGSITLP
jgi:Concanavalin A-like lectin/glucanases superfamily